jgi:hypothetical protein
MLIYEHAKILDLYLSRISIADLEKIVEAKKECARAALNQGNSAQLVAHGTRAVAVTEAVEHLIEWDRDIITRRVKDVVRL